MFEELTKRIDQLLTHPPTVVAVSGFGGSGKTTLAERIKARYANSTLVQLDNFLTNRGVGDGMNGGYDWERFVDVVRDAKHGEPLHYQWYDWHADALAGFIDGSSLKRPTTWTQARECPQAQAKMPSRSDQREATVPMIVRPRSESRIPDKRVQETSGS
jgi:hypothetical protein